MGCAAERAIRSGYNDIHNTAQALRHEKQLHTRRQMRVLIRWEIS